MSHRPFLSLGTVATVVLALLLWAGALLVPIPTQKEPLQVAVGMWVGAEPWVLAREAGELDPAEINIVEMNWTSAAMRAVGNRVVDAAVLTLDEVIRQIHQGYPLKVVMITDISRGADWVMAKDTIPDVAHLAGCRIGYEPRTSGAWLLDKALHNSGLRLSDVQQVPLNPAEVEEIFHELKLDAVVLSEPWGRRLSSLKLRKLYDSSQTGIPVVRALVVHPDEMETHRSTLVAMLKAHFKWMPHLKQGGPELDPILRREGVSKDELQDILRHIETVDLPHNLKLLKREEPWLGQLFEDLQKNLAEDFAGGRPLSAAEVFDTSLLEELP